MGDPARALDDQLALIRRQLVRSVARICPAQLGSEQDDIVQVALIRLSERLSRAPEAECTPGFVWKVAYSVTVDEIRRRRRRSEVDLADIPEEGGVPFDARPGPDQQVEARRQREGLRVCLRALRVERRRAVTLHLLGHTVPETGRLMSWNPKRAANLVYRGLADLRACLTNKGLAP